MDPAQEPLGVDHDALGAVLRLAHRDQVTRLSRRGSMVSSPPERLTTTQSIRGRIGASHLPSTLM